VILVDTSIWIELLNGRLGARVSEEQLLNFATCGPVAQEVLQGLRSSPAAEELRQAFLALPMLSDPLPSSIFLPPRFSAWAAPRATPCGLPPTASSPPLPSKTARPSGTTTATTTPSRAIPTFVPLALDDIG
jgi:hypothetical protein